MEKLQMVVSVDSLASLFAQYHIKSIGVGAATAPIVSYALSNDKARAEVWDAILTFYTGAYKTNPEESETHPLVLRAVTMRRLTQITRLYGYYIDMETIEINEQQRTVTIEFYHILLKNANIVGMLRLLAEHIYNHAGKTPTKVNPERLTFKELPDNNPQMAKIQASINEKIAHNIL